MGFNSGFKGLKSGQEYRVLYMKTNIHFCLHLFQFYLEWEMVQTKVVEKIKTQFHVQYLFSENREIYEIMRKNMVQPDRPQKWHMHIVWRIPKATNTHRICNTYEIMRKNMVQPDRPQKTIWHMRIVWCIPKATNTHRICNTYCCYTATMVTRTHLNVAL